MQITRLPTTDVLASLGTSAAGLDPVEAQRRLGEFGRNRIEEMRGQPLWLKFLREFSHFFALILWVASALAFFAESRNPGSGMLELGVAILVVILVNGIFSFLQEYRAERAISELRKLLPVSVKVMRSGVLHTEPADVLVPGDVVLLQEGDDVPADCRLIESSGVRVNLATVTGESLPQFRSPEPVTDVRPLDARNLLLAGTSLVTGEATAVVYATGMRTEFGRIAHLTQTTGEAGSPLQREIAHLSRFVAFLALGLGLACFAIGAAIGLSTWHSAMFAIGVIVANVPEGLLPTVTLSLALATQRMAKRNALVRTLPSVETLGSATVICSDKTGTLTQNRMTVKQAFVAGGGDAATAVHLLRNARRCNNLKRGANAGLATWLGDPMEAALVEFGGGGESSAERVVEEIPFDGDRRRMSVVVESGARRWLYCKGAPEVVLGLCAAVEMDGTVQPLDEAHRREIGSAQELMAGQGLRILGFAYRELVDGEAPLEQELTFSGLIGLRDPPRPEVPDAVRRCRAAGIKVIMVTGDHPHTAVAIAREIGLVTATNPVVIHGETLRRMTAAQLQLALDAPEILFTRVTAEQKLIVVEALKQKGHIVAVTGDGVNDAPALRTAHIGIAMGVTGTDVARAAADIVLLDDNFASIVNAVEEGRAVYENIRKFLTYILTSNIPELVPYLAYVLFRIPLPLTVIQILAVDLGTDMLPALALGAERPDGTLMDRPPRPAKERLLSRALLFRAYLWLGPLQAAAAMTAFFFVLWKGGWTYGEVLAAADPLYLQATSACLAAIVVAQVVNVFLCRHAEQSALSLDAFSNPLLLAGVAVEAMLILLIVHTPLGNAAFGTRAFQPQAWVLMVALSLGIGLLEELRKAAVRSSGTMKSRMCAPHQGAS